MVELENNLTNRIITRDDAKNSFVKFILYFKLCKTFLHIIDNL